MKGRMAEGRFLVAVESGNLVVRTKFPVGWIIAAVGAWAAVAGSPQLIQVLAQALGS